MDVVTVVISVLALLIAIPSLIYTRSVARIEGSRRHDERVPDVSLVVEATPLGIGELDPDRYVTVFYEYELWLTVKSAEPLTGVTVNLLNPESFSFKAGQAEVSQDDPAVVRHEGQLGPGDQKSWELEPGPGASGGLEARIVCFRGKEMWVILREATTGG